MPVTGQTTIPFEIIPAGRLTTAVPANLPALRYQDRSPVSPGIRLVAVGDIGFSGRVARHDTEGQLSAVFQRVAPFLQAADLVFGNLETPLVAREAGAGLFAGQRAGGAVLRNAGFDLLHLANNHFGDYGAAGMAATLELLAANELAALGAGITPEAARRPVVVERGGLRIGWLGCGRTRQKQGASPAFWEFDEAVLATAVAEIKADVDFLAVSIHSGLMYLDYPDPAQRRTAEAVAKAGADLVLFHHAHVLQGVDRLPGGAIACHSLGNFLLDWQEGHVAPDVAVREQREGGIFLFDIDAEGVYQAAVLPTWLADDCTVDWAVGERGEHILRRLQAVSVGLEEDYTAIFTRQRAERNIGVTVRVIAHHLRRGNFAVLGPALRQLRPRHLGLLWHWLRQRIGAGVA